MDKPQPPPISTPHNNLFQSGLSNPRTVAGLIRQMLPAKVVAQLDLSTLRQQAESFIDKELRDSQSDVIYLVRTCPDSDGNRSEVLIYFLIEHKSETDTMTPFQLLKYMVRIWERCHRNGEPLRPIVPLVVYHGEAEWRKNRTFGELIPYQDDLVQFSVQFAFPILDLWRTKNEKLSDSQDLFLQSLLYLLKYGRSSQLPEYLPEVFRLIALTNEPQLADDRIFTAWIYIMATNPNISTDSVKQAINQSFPTYVYPDSILGKERQAGREEGIEQGMEKGMEAGILIAKIQMHEERCGLPITSIESFKSWSIAELKAKLSEIDSAAKD